MVKSVDVTEPLRAPTSAEGAAETFLDRNGWGGSLLEPLNGDASARRYFRVRLDRRSAVLMDASRIPESVPPFVRVDEHLNLLGFSAPAILARDESVGLLLLEDFGDDTFSRLLDDGHDAAGLFALATDVLAALHREAGAIPPGLRTYIPEAMLADLGMFLEWRTPEVSDAGQAEFQRAWREVLPLAHGVPGSLLLRDYHSANLMSLPGREGVRKAGLLDFQDAYQGPITYDLVSLLEDARRDISDEVRTAMIGRYLAQVPAVDREAFEVSMVVVAALRHTRVLAVFEKLKRRDDRPDYARLHCARVERLLNRALRHPILSGVRRWMEHYGIAN